MIFYSSQLVATILTNKTKCLLHMLLFGRSWGIGAHAIRLSQEHVGDRNNEETWSSSQTKKKWHFSCKKCPSWNRHIALSITLCLKGKAVALPCYFSIPLYWAAAWYFQAPDLCWAEKNIQIAWGGYHSYFHIVPEIKVLVSSRCNSLQKCHGAHHHASTIAGSKEDYTQCILYTRGTSTHTCWMTCCSSWGYCCPQLCVQWELQSLQKQIYA